MLPALPSAWAEGSAGGLCARGGFEVDLAWAGGALTGGQVRSKLGRRLCLRTHTCVSTAVDGRVVTGSEDANRPGEWTFKFDTAAGDAYELTVGE